MSLWRLSHRSDPEVRPLADRHYNRQKVGAPGFAPPGRCLVLKREDHRRFTGPTAYWITSWPFAQYVKHKWAGAWVCSAFRNEAGNDGPKASDLILSAVAATRAYYGEPPLMGMITFVDRKKVEPIKVRGADVWGWTYLKAGFEVAGESEGGLLCLRLRPDNMPPELPFIGFEQPHKHFRSRWDLLCDRAVEVEKISL